MSEHDAYEAILSELEERQCEYVRRYPPYYISSIGAHIFNLVNKRKKIHFIFGLLLDMRLHLFMVAPPGFSKTFWLDHFLSPNVGILYETPIFTGFEGFMTEAGWVGSIEIVNHTPVIRYGAAKTYENGIVGCEEFSAVVEAMKTQHSKHLDAALLLSLDSGRVLKRLRGGKIDYETRATLWSATQATRFDLTSGMGRRLFFMTFFPNESDKIKLKLARRRAHGVRYNPAKLKKVREMITNKFKQAEAIESLKFSDSVWKCFDDFDMLHFEEPLYERLLVGYTLMKYPVRKNMTIYVDRTARSLVRQEVEWRTQIKRGTLMSQVVSMLKDAKGALALTSLKDKLLDFGLDWTASTQLIDRLLRSKVIYIRQGVVYLWRFKKR